MPTQLMTVVIMLTLLITQISGTFASPTALSSISSGDCSMTMASELSSQPMSNSLSMSEHEMIYPSESQPITPKHSITMKMDCCDNDNMEVCCEGLCGCFAFSVSSAFLVFKMSEKKLDSTNETFSDGSSLPHSAFSALLIRPPIHSLT